MTQNTTNLYCDEIIFHFNKAHLQDPTIPMWILKFKGTTHYIHHLDANIPFNTKETPNNIHTKGSIKFKKCFLNIDSNLNATITQKELHNDLYNGN